MVVVSQVSQSVVEVSRDTILEFLKTVDIRYPNYTRDYELESQVKSIVKTWGNEENLRRYVITALILTVTAYRHITSLETRTQITLFTTLIIAFDDPAVLDSLASRDFHQRMCTGSVQHDSGLLGEFTRILEQMWQHYGEFPANTIYTSALRFVNACLLENEYKGNVLNARALPFVEYKRSMSATTEAYACFIWPKERFPDPKVYMQALPDVMLYVSYVNDVLSFYKEELAGETETYIHERASVTGKSVADTLRDVIGDTVSAVERIRDILGEGEARNAWESFAAGYISVHTGNPRYRLQEIIGGDYILDVTTY